METRRAVLLLWLLSSFDGGVVGRRALPLFSSHCSDFRSVAILGILHWVAELTLLEPQFRFGDKPVKK